MSPKPYPVRLLARTRAVVHQFAVFARLSRGHGRYVPPHHRMPFKRHRYKMREYNATCDMPGRCCSSRHGMPFDSIHEGCKMFEMTWREISASCEMALRFVPSHALVAAAPQALHLRSAPSPPPAPAPLRRRSRLAGLTRRGASELSGICTTYRPRSGSRCPHRPSAPPGQ